MPKILDRLTSQLKAKGMGTSQAFAVATSQLQKHGILKKGTQALTTKGKTRNSMTPSERAKDRQSKVSGHKTSDYKYSSKTNLATLKKKK